MTQALELGGGFAASCIRRHNTSARVSSPAVVGPGPRKRDCSGSNAARRPCRRSAEAARREPVTDFGIAKQRRNRTRKPRSREASSCRSSSSSVDKQFDANGLSFTAPARRSMYGLAHCTLKQESASSCTSKVWFRLPASRTASFASSEGCTTWCASWTTSASASSERFRASRSRRAVAPDDTMAEIAKAAVKWGKTSWVGRLSFA